jgi:hypothetical protein
MAEFSGKIVDAYYFSEDYTMIEVIYKNENDEMVSYVMEANPEHSDMQALEEDGWNVEKLAEATAQYKRQQANAFSEAINIQVQERLREVINTSFKDKEKQLQEKEKELQAQRKILLTSGSLEEVEKELRAQRKILDDQMYDMILNTNQDKEYLFKFKLWALEQPAIKDSSKTVKSELRKSKTILEGLSVLHNVLAEKSE